MPQPYIAYLVYGYVYNSLGSIVPNATLKVTTSVGTKEYATNSDGIFMYDLAEVGYTSGETVTVNLTEPYNNEIKAHTFVVEGFWKNENITLRLRTVAGVKTVGYITTPILHSVGHKPITSDNPLPVSDSKELLKGYELSGSDDDNWIYGYVDKNGNWYIQKSYSTTGLIKYAKGSSDFETNWNNRTNLTYQFFNEVF